MDYRSTIYICLISFLPIKSIPHKSPMKQVTIAFFSLQKADLQLIYLQKERRLFKTDTAGRAFRKK